VSAGKAISEVTGPRRPPARPAPDASQTPAMRQYLEQKAAVPDAILLFRMGDFYETFYDDAQTLARELGLALTTRNKDDANPIPLAGVPYHAVDGYVARLVRAGYKVAISEQVEDPRTAKGLVRREIVRIITPGTLTDETLLEEKRDNWLAAICTQTHGATSAKAPGKVAWGFGRTDESVGFACVELASGRFYAQMAPTRAVIDELSRLRPAEVLVVDQPIDAPDPLVEELRQSLGAAVTTRPPHCFDAHAAERTLCDQFGTTGLTGFGFERTDASIQAAGALLDYLRETQKAALAHILKIETRCSDDYLAIDQTTLRALEVEQTIRDGQRNGSLLWAVDRTVNPMGARRLREWLCYPLRDAAAIRRRQHAVAALQADRMRLTRLRGLIREMGDIERISARLGVGRAGPRDLVALGRTIGRFAELREALRQTNTLDTDELLAGITADLEGLDECGAFLRSSLREDAPPIVREGGFVAAGYSAELDRLHSIQADGHRWLAEFQAAEAQRTGIPSLKVSYNQVFGYYIEVTNTHRDKVPPDYVRRQTVRNAERYVTEALKKHETEVLGARDRAVQLEIELFEQIRVRVVEQMPRLQRAAEAVAMLDVLAGLAEWGQQRGHCLPEVVDRPPTDKQPSKNRTACILEIEDGRHPVLDQTLGERFVPNDCRLTPDGDRLLVITGPNMAGKSTYIRQVALLVLLAQTGAPVPARAMRFVPADRLFARVGASDELARGQSTFMVEMVETARILNSATKSSLVILDEIGRGTSTFDGLALAWAITEHLAGRVGCRTLFATHYHELTELASSRPGVANFNVAVQEHRRSDGREEVIFLHRIVPGGTDKSYGIHVARMAGVPPSVVARAVHVLAELEQNFAAESGRVLEKPDPAQGTLFPPAPPPPAWWEALAAEIERIDLDRTTPIDALSLLRDVQERLRAQPSK
jgi:DNA mismatch repair protein MutS